ncbi:MAG: DUF2336 domain-containing protein [Pseudomonadota bacterium]
MAQSPSFDGVVQGLALPDADGEAETRVPPTAQPYLARTIRHLSDLLFLPQGRLSRDAVRLIDDVLGRLIPYASLDLRCRLAQRFAGLAHPPRNIARALLHDRIEVAAILLTSPARFNEVDLVHVVSHGSSEHGRLIAVREDLTSAVAQRLAMARSREFSLALLRNHSADFGRPEFELIIRHALDCEEIWDALLDRPELPNDLALHLFWVFDGARRFRLLKRCMADLSLIDELMTDEALTTVAQIDPLVSDAIRPLQKIKPFSTTEAARLKTLALADSPKDLIDFLEERLALSRDFLVRVVQDVEGEAFGILAKACALPRDQFVLLLDVLFPKRAAKEERERGAGLFFDTLSWDHADSVVRTWDLGIRTAELDDRSDEAGGL